MKRLNFNNRNTGRVKRAAWYLRAGRALRRKRVSIARTGALQAMRRVRKEAARLAHLAKAYDVPMDEMAALPAIPELPSQKWVDHLQALGELAPVVKAAPPETIQAPA